MIHCPISHSLLEADRELLVFGQHFVAEYWQSEAMLSMTNITALSDKQSMLATHTPCFFLGDNLCRIAGFGEGEAS
jgi:hypothetical protein